VCELKRYTVDIKWDCLSANWWEGHTDGMGKGWSITVGAGQSQGDSTVDRRMGQFLCRQLIYV
jgi:hypothetical protein